MTSLQALFDYEGSIGERESRAAAGIRDVSGSGVLFDEKMHRIIVDYDASRLKEGNITFLLRNAGIRLRNTIGKAAA